MAIAESTHWYDKSGTPAYTVIGANGKERATTLRDARKSGYLPSVTSIIGIAAKPGLENWKIDQALLSALTLPRVGGESLDEFMARAKQDAKEQSLKAAERGTEIHAGIESGFNGAPPTDAYRAVREWLDSNYPGQEWIAEDSFGHPAGYGGKLDLYSSGGIFVDFKTKDGLLAPEKMVYDEHGMQLSAYAHGKNCADPERVSVFVDRSNHSQVAAYVWPKETHSKHLDMFMHLLKYWQLLKGYQP
jgi:hypothetical protein